jgi:hypothetical protein
VVVRNNQEKLLGKASADQLWPNHKFVVFEAQVSRMKTITARKV